EWSSNPWIREANGGMLTAKKYNRTRVCTLQELHIQRIGLAAYTLRISLTSDATTHHTAPKLCRWALAIIAGSP
ncbi:hypothetical protein PHYSODRAFT_420838, partial [Phytophthora sojae]